MVSSLPERSTGAVVKKALENSPLSKSNPAPLAVPRIKVNEVLYFLTLAVQNDDFLLTAIYQVVKRSGKFFWVNRSTFSYLCKYVCTQKEESFRQHQRGGDRQEFGQT